MQTRDRSCPFTPGVSIRRCRRHGRHARRVCSESTWVLVPACHREAPRRRRSPVSQWRSESISRPRRIELDESSDFVCGGVMREFLRGGIGLLSPITIARSPCRRPRSIPSAPGPPERPRTRRPNRPPGGRFPAPARGRPGRRTGGSWRSSPPGGRGAEGRADEIKSGPCLRSMRLRSSGALLPPSRPTSTSRPRGASAARLPASADPPRKSITTSTPAPTVRERTAVAKSSLAVSMA